MKPAWDDLGTKFADSSSVQIVDVDCTADGGQVCQKMGVRGYPTIKYFTSETESSGDKYVGGRDLASLSKFVEEKLVMCDIEYPDQCDADDKPLIEEASKSSSVAESLKDYQSKVENLREERIQAKKDLASKEEEWAMIEKTLHEEIHIYKQFAKKE